jgi:hypothetical protein
VERKVHLREWKDFKTEKASLVKQRDSLEEKLANERENFKFKCELCDHKQKAKAK